MREARKAVAEIAPSETAEKRLELLKQYLSLGAMCEVCEAPIRRGDPAHAVVVVAVEWMGANPILLKSQTICETCAPHTVQFELDNPLFTNFAPSPPPEVRAIQGLSKEEVRNEEVRKEEVRKEEARGEQRVQQKSAALEDKKRVLKGHLLLANGIEEHQRLKKEIEAIDKQIKAAWSGLLKEQELDDVPMSREVYMDPTSLDEMGDGNYVLLSTPQEATERAKDREWDRLCSFLNGSYAEKLTAQQRKIGKFYVSGLTETRIAKRMKISQATVSRRLNELKTEANRRQ